MRCVCTLSVAAAVGVGMLACGAAARGGEPSADQTAAMQGTWTVESFTIEGKPIEATELRKWRRTVERNHVTWTSNGQTLAELDIKFDPASKPMTLDSTIASGDQKGQTLLAIFELKGDELRVCFAKADQPRPTDFSSSAANGQSVYTCRRVKP